MLLVGYKDLTRTPPSLKNNNTKPQKYRVVKEVYCEHV